MMRRGFIVLSLGRAWAEISVTVANSTTVRERIMPSEQQNMSEQDISIKAREHELYLPALPDAPPVKPFPEYLRDTPGEPLSFSTKLVLSFVGVIVAVLFFAAIWRITHPRATKPRARAARPAAKASHLVGPRAPLAVSSAVPFTLQWNGVIRSASLWPRDASPLPVSYGLDIDTEADH
jgi:hypothetical protein